MSQHTTQTRKQTLILSSCIVALVAIGAATALHGWSGGTIRNDVTVNRPVALPGVVLDPGSYVFEALRTDSSFRIVRVSTRGGQGKYIGFASPVERPATLLAGQAMSLGEVPADTPQPILAWYPLGMEGGLEFIYQ